MLNQEAVDNGQTQEVTPVVEQGGYFNGSYTMGVDDPQTLADNAQAEEDKASGGVSPEELSSIAAKLGVDVEALSGLLGVDKPEEATTEEPEKTEEELSEEDKQIKERLLAVDKEVQNLLGVGLTEVYGLLQELQAFKAQYVVEQQTSILKQEWGANYEETLQEVRGYWEKLPETQKQALDNVEGARLIHALISKEKGSKAASQQSPYVRQGSARPRSGANPKFRMSEVVKLSEADYQRIQPELEDAFRRGLVINDIR